MKNTRVIIDYDEVRILFLFPNTVASTTYISKSYENLKQSHSKHVSKIMPLPRSTMTPHRQHTRSVVIPAIAAADKFVRSIRLTQYMTPTVMMRRRSILCMIFLCSSGVNSLSISRRRAFFSLMICCFSWSSLGAFSS